MEIIKLPHYGDLELPTFGTPDSAAIDLRAAFDQESVVLKPGDDIKIPSGLKIFIGSHPLHTIDARLGMVGLIMPRSGLGFKHFVRLANTTGVIDADYQDEIFIKIRNEGTVDLTINRGDRICQMMFTYFIRGFEFNVVDQFTSATERTGGLGHTGTK